MLGKFSRKFSSRSFPFHWKFATRIGVDFIINNRETYKIASDSLLDALWSSSNKLFLLWAFSSKDSSFVIRQAAAAVFNTSRLMLTTSVSCYDLAFSIIISKIYSKARTFSIASASERSIIRLLNTFRKNGGIYTDISDIIRNFLNATQASPGILAINDVWNKFPCVDDEQFTHHEVNVKRYFNELQKTFKKEFGGALSDFIDEINNEPTEVGSFIIFDGKLKKTGESISITFMSPNTERMRKLDLIPFKLLGKVVNILPGLSFEKKLYNSFIKRINYSISSEIESRLLILQKYGVDINELNPKIFFKNSRKIPLPIYIAAPLKSLCTSHVMISDVQPQKFEKLRPKDTKSLSNFTADLLFDKGCIVGDLSRGNLRMHNNKISLNKFSSFTQIDNCNMSAGFSLLFSCALKREKRAIKAGQVLGISDFLVSKMVNTGKVQQRAVRQALDKNAELVLPLAEAVCGIVNSKIESNAGFFAMSNFALGTVAKAISPSKSHRNFPFSIGKILQHFPF